MADSPTEADDMTPEDQNRENSETDDIMNILGNFLDADEETLEDLVGGMMYLTMDDVQKFGKKASASAVQKNPNVKKSNLDVSQGRAEGQDPSSQPRNTSENTPTTDADGVEEEFLDEEGGKRTDESLFRHRPASLTKFDNFVSSAEGTDPAAGRDDTGDGDDDNDGDWMPSSGYMASFAGGENATEQVKTESEFPNKCESSTDSSLKKDSLQSTDRSQDKKSTQSESDLTPASENTTAARKTVSDLDSKASECEPDDTSTVCDVDVETPAWPVNPGEVEEEDEDEEVKQKVNVMEFSMKVVSITNAGERTEKNTVGDTETCSDDVVPFTLDEDFDYDNVIYTPKFTQAEMEYLTSFVPKSSS